MLAERELLNKAMAALSRHEFAVEYFERREEAVDWLASRAPEGTVAGMGGSITLRSIGLPERLRQQGVTVLDHWEVRDPQARDELFRQCLNADNYFTSANAISADGYVLNVDGNGNRVAMEAFGPKHLYIVAGVNKLTADVTAAFERIRYVAPKNCARVGFKTPCVKTGECVDCNVPDRSCRAYLLLRCPSRTVPATVVFINEELGI